MFEDFTYSRIRANIFQVQTDMGNGGARAFGLEEAPMSLETSMKGVLELIDNATREKTSGTFQSADPEVPCAW